MIVVYETMVGEGAGQLNKKQETINGIVVNGLRGKRALRLAAGVGRRTTDRFGD